MRLSAAVVSGLASAAFAAPTTSATGKPKDAAIHLPLYHPNATESLAALRKASNETYHYVHTFTAIVEQHCDQSDTKTWIAFSPVLDSRDDTVERPLGDFPVRLWKRARPCFDYAHSTFYASLVKDVLPCVYLPIRIR
jgi:hypothetical protein